MIFLVRASDIGIDGGIWPVSWLGNLDGILVENSLSNMQLVICSHGGVMAPMPG